MANKWVYMFSEGDMTMRNLLGGKGANLAEMTSIGLPVPQGFTITTEACTQYYEDGRKINDEIMAQAMEGVKKMEEINGKKFGDLKNPLLVSVRSGARASMPGMMDTILNLGLNDEVVAAMIAGNPDPAFERFVYDSYRRFIQMFSDVVMEVGKKYFEELIDKMKEEKGVKQDVDLDADDLKKLAEQFKAEYKAKIGEDFPTDPKVQLMEAVKAVFRSWDNPRANVYRRDNDIPYSWGTAVNVQMMAFGNMGDDCGTGVAFTRDPATGENGLFGEFLTNAQGEDVVAGVRTPMHISEMEEKFPEAFVQASATRRLCPDHCQFIFRKSHEKRSCHTAERNILIWIVAHPQKIHEQTDLHRGEIPCFRGNVHRDPFLCQHCLQLLDRTCAATHQNHDIPVRQRMHLSGFDILNLLPAHKRTDLFCDHIGFAFAGCERIFFLTFIQ